MSRRRTRASLAKGPGVFPVVTGLLTLASVAPVMTGCPGKVDVSLQQACADYTQIFRSRESVCYDVAPEPDESVLKSRQIEACALSSGASGSQVGASYWESCAAAANNGCAGYECAPYPAGTRQAGEPCLVAQQCASLFCRGVGVPGDVAIDICEVGFSCFDGACRKQGIQGEPCNVWNDCALPAWVCKSSGVCDSVTSDGQPCVTQSDCTTDTGCGAGTHVCTPVMFGQPGTPCDGNVFRCEAGQCDPTSGVCPKVASDGAACDPSDLSVVCDDYASCFRGQCQIPDPNTCE